jgi:hypothetical protein
MHSIGLVSAELIAPDIKEAPTFIAISFYSYS